ncbi:MAG: FAD-binding protein [Sphingobacteriales bacterium]|nr:MAG: FAD-binding protein [Sphingobacteriales bacterium]
MNKKLVLSLPPEVAFQPEKLQEFVKKQLNISEADELQIQLLKRSIDARSREVKVNLEAHIYINEKIPQESEYNFDYQNVTNNKPVLIAGAGPAGLFAALRLIELGLKPIIIERGKDVRARRRDLAAITKDHVVNPDSNYCFGEGGAGTYSDGKLYTRSTKRGDVKRILHILVNHGAKDDILIDAHPHIGTNKLPKLIEQIRYTILNHGGEIHFDTRITDFIVSGNEFKGVETQNGDKILGEGLILATGHSARDIFELLHSKNILIESKPFAMGVRVEHPQSIIDSIQYHKPNRGEFLPAAAYALVCQTQYDLKQRGVFSFCMCPGGFIVPAATAQGEVVVNGMSPSRRDSRFANSGIVVSIEQEDLKYEAG